MKRCALLLAISGLLSAADPYTAWSQGRPDEAVTPLIASGRESGRWDAWLDAGLAASAAGQHGPAVACLVQAHNLAPEQTAPRNALRALGVALPTTWCERAGPIALPGTGWAAVAVLSLAGLGLGLGLGRSRWRPALLTGSGVLLIVAAPGLLAVHLDRSARWAATVRDTQALDSTGAPIRAIPAGTLLQLSGWTWDQRSGVSLPDGQACWLPISDLMP
jgi:hypothetical protein